MSESQESYDVMGRTNFSEQQTRNFLSRTLPNNLEALSPAYFFNTPAIINALSLLSPDLPKSQERVFAYFNQVQFEVVSGRSWTKRRMGNWWTPIQRHFIPGIQNMPAGVENRYFYGNSPNVKVTNSFTPKEDIYQIFSSMFNRALNAFACFVNKDQPQLSISSWNHTGDPSFERFGHTDRLAWYGRLGDFLQSAEILEQTLRKIREEGYRSNPEAYRPTSSDVRLIHPQSGMIIMRGHNQEIQALIPNEDGRLKFGQITLPKTIILKNKDLEALIAA